MHRFPEVVVVDGLTFMNSPTWWLVSYMYADPDGGGSGVDYFVTKNRYTPPTGPEILRDRATPFL